MKIEQIGNTIVIYNTNEKTKYPHSIYKLTYGNDEYIEELKREESKKQELKEKKLAKLKKRLDK